MNLFCMTHLLSLRHCPICGSRFKSYLVTGTSALVWNELQAVGAGKRRAICPHCGSSDRERLIYLYLRDTYLPPLKEKKIHCLHIAPEAHISEFLKAQPNIDYTAGDKRCAGYSYPDYVQDIDIMEMHDIPDASFDLIICNHVLEHVSNDIIAMKELRRILKNDGIAILQVPLALKLATTIDDPTITSPEQRFEKYGQRDHVRLYGRDYSERLKEAGLVVKELNIARQYSQKYGLNKHEHLFRCHKQ